MRNAGKAGPQSFSESPKFPEVPEQKLRKVRCLTLANLGLLARVAILPVCVSELHPTVEKDLGLVPCLLLEKLLPYLFGD